MWDWDGELWRAADLERAGAGAAFSSRLGGCSRGAFASLNLGAEVGDRPEDVDANRARFAARAGFAPDSVAPVRQVHGGAVLSVSGPGAAGTADGLCTDAPGVTLIIAVADCAAVYLVDPERGAIGLCHAGWRGTVAAVAARCVATMAARFGCRPENLRAAVSPCIGACCYEVDGPVIAALTGQPGCLRPTDPAHARLDIAEANRRQLLGAGLDPARIAVAGICTACHPPTLFSHRRDAGRTGRMHAALWLR